MLRILMVAIVSAGGGAVLGAGDGLLPVRTGVVGAGLFMVGALLVRRRWLGDPNAAPGSPEQALWLALAANTCVGSYLAAMLLRIGPNFTMHTPLVHRFGIDTWTLVIASAIASWIARDPEPREDERDLAIAARGRRVAYWGLVGMLVVLILALGFVDRGWVGAWSRPGIAHALILVILLSVVLDTLSRLVDYARDNVAGDVPS